MSLIPLIYLYSKLAADPATPAKYPHFNDFVKTLPASKRTSFPAVPPEPQVDLTEANKQLRQRQRIAAMQRAQMNAPPEPQLDLTEVNRQLAAKRKAIKAGPANMPATQPAYDPKAPYISSKFAKPKGYYNWYQVVRAMKQEESPNDEIYGDYVNGKPTSFGHYQIHEWYAKDAGIKGDWQKAVMNPEVAKKAIHTYMKRYAPEYIPKDLNSWLSPAAIRAITRIHNGGPDALRATGEELYNVTRYNNRINKHLRDLFGE